MLNYGFRLHTNDIAPPRRLNPARFIGADPKSLTIRLELATSAAWQCRDRYSFHAHLRVKRLLHEAAPEVQIHHGGEPSAVQFYLRRGEVTGGPFFSEAHWGGTAKTAKLRKDSFDSTVRAHMD